MTDSNDAVKQGLLARFIQFGDEFHSIKRQIEEHQEAIKAHEQRREELNKLGEALIEAAKVFDFDLVAAYREKTGRYGDVAGEATAPTATDAPRRPSIKKFVLRAAQQAHPKPVRAASIRADLAAQGEEVHEKTVGMTLYRLLKKGLLKREGFDWYFVPEEERAAQEEGADA